MIDDYLNSHGSSGTEKRRDNILSARRREYFDYAKRQYAIDLSVTIEGTDGSESDLRTPPRLV